uniref:Uncharacterized protein n=1 Tax=Fagus sylvatica TaxID=28930 RepID=A0A2N9IAT7_FAGSY
MDERLRTRRSGSSNWKGLRKGHEVFRKGLRWVVNNGHTVGGFRVCDVVEGVLASSPLIYGLVIALFAPWCMVLCHEDTLRVCDVVEGVHMWNLSILSLDIPACTREA